MDFTVLDIGYKKRISKTNRCPELLAVTELLKAFALSDKEKFV